MDSREKSRNFLSAIFLMLLVSLMSGCALTKDYVNLEYTPQQNIDSFQGADKVKVNVTVNDVRSMKDKVSYKKNGYGMEMAEIIPSNDVVQLVRESIKTELKNRGFNVSEGSIMVNIDLIKYFNDFKMGFFAGDAAAEIIMNAQVKDEQNNIRYNKVINGSYVESDIQLAGGNNAKLALDGALRDGVSKLVNDDELIAALMITNR